MRSADGWVCCRFGHRHWGTAGAAGLLVHRDGTAGLEVLLEHRARWVAHGGTWGIPGGALQHGESPQVGAVREAIEELGIHPESLAIGPCWVDDHGGWSYATVLAAPVRDLRVTDLRLSRESIAAAWVPVADLGGWELHPGFAASLPRLLDLLVP